jgi:tetratricopeptide (TPR) repeat protein
VSDANLQKLFQQGQTLLRKAQKLFTRQKWQQSQPILERARKIFVQTQSSLMIARTDYMLGTTYENEMRWTKAVDSYLLCLEETRPAGTQIQLADVHKKLARMHLNLNQLEQAHEYAQLAIDLLEHEKGSRQLSAEVFFLQGSLFYLENVPKSALFYFDLALDSIKTNTNWNIYLEVQENRGMIHHQLGNYTASNEAFLKALPLEHKKKNFPSIASLLQQVAINYETLGEKDKALKYMKDSMKIREHLDLPNKDTVKAQSLKLYADMLFRFRRFQQADDTCNEIIEMAELTNDNMLLVESLLLKLKILLSQGVASEDQQTLIRNYLTEIDAIAAKLKNYLFIIRGRLMQKEFLQKIGKRDKILPLLQEILEQAEESNENQGLGEILEQLGLFHHAHQDFEKAHAFFAQALQHFTSCNSKDDIAESHYNLACTANRRHLPEETLDHLAKAIQSRPKYKVLAQNDEDFKSIMNEKLFLDLVK